MTKLQAKVLLDDLECKKYFDANFSSRCSSCDNQIDVGDGFVFMGNKKKVCTQCLADMQDYLEEIAS